MIRPKKVLEKLSPKISDIKNQNRRLKLDENENIYGISNYMINAIKSFDFAKISEYPDSTKLIEKLSEKYRCNKDNFILTNGSIEAFNLIISSYMENNDEIISYNPLDDTQIILQGASFREIQYSEKFKFNPDEIKNQISQNTKIVYLSNPDIITGEFIKPSMLERIIRELLNSLFIIDCSYIGFEQNASLEDYIDLADRYDNVIIIKSFSYDYALAGLRLGFIYGQDNVIQNIKKITPDYNVNALALYCGYFALNDEKYTEEIISNNANARNLFFDSLIEKGFKPYASSGNFILCDFSDHCDFYYKKLKNNGVLVKNFPRGSKYSTCLRIAVPKLGGVKYILELLNKKDVLIFNPDGIIFNTEESFDSAAIQVFRHFSGYDIMRSEILQVKNLGKYNCLWDVVKYLLEKERIYVDLEDIMGVFLNLVYNPSLKEQKFLIDNDKLIFSKELLNKLSQKYDMVLFTDRLKLHIDYSLKKFEIDKYFHYIVSSDDLIIEHQKPNPKGVLEILKHCPHKSVKYIGNCVDDIIAGNSADVETIGVITSGEQESIMVNNYRHLGANYIVKDIDKIINFLEKNEQNEFNLV